MKSLIDTFDRLNSDRERQAEREEVYWEKRDVHELIHNALDKLRISRVLFNRTTRHPFGWEDTRADRIDKPPKDEVEQRFIQEILTSVPLMQKSSRLMGSLRNCLFDDEGHRKDLDAHSILEVQVANLHKMKISTARTCWREFKPKDEELAILQVAHQRLKDTHREMQSQYVKEIADSRDRLRQRIDVEDGSSDIVMSYEPFQHCEPQWQRTIFDIVKEKVKMVFDNNPSAASRCNVTHLNAMKVFVESNELTEAKTALKKKIKENDDLKSKLAASERTILKISSNKAANVGCTPEAMLSMDRALDKMRLDMYNTQQELNATKKSKANAQDRLTELERLHHEKEKAIHQLELDNDDLRNQIAGFPKAQAKLTEQLERQEKKLKETDAALATCKQQMVRYKKLAKANEKLGSSGAQGKATEAESSMNIGIESGKKQLSERSNESTLKEVLAVAEQNEQELEKANEKNTELREENKELQETNHELLECQNDLIHEMATMHLDHSLSQVDHLAEMWSEMLQTITDGNEDDDFNEPNDEVKNASELRLEISNVEAERVKNASELGLEISSVEAELSTLVKELKDVPAASWQVTDDPNVASVLVEKQRKIAELVKQKMKLMCRFVMMSDRNGVSVESMVSSSECRTLWAWETAANEGVEKALGNGSERARGPVEVTEFGKKETANENYDAVDLRRKLTNHDDESSKSPSNQPQKNCSDAQTQTVSDSGAGHKRTVAMLKIHIEQITKTLQDQSSQNEALHETIEDLQHENENLLKTFQGMKNMTNMESLQAALETCLQVGRKMQRLSVFDRLYADVERRQSLPVSQRVTKHVARGVRESQRGWHNVTRTKFQEVVQDVTQFQDGSGGQNVPNEFDNKERVELEVVITDLPKEQMGIGGLDPPMTSHVSGQTVIQPSVSVGDGIPAPTDEQHFDYKLAPSAAKAPLIESIGDQVVNRKAALSTGSSFAPSAPKPPSPETQGDQVVTHKAAPSSEITPSLDRNRTPDLQPVKGTGKKSASPAPSNGLNSASKVPPWQNSNSPTKKAATLPELAKTLPPISNVATPSEQTSNSSETSQLLSGPGRTCAELLGQAQPDSKPSNQTQSHAGSDSHTSGPGGLPPPGGPQGAGRSPSPHPPVRCPPDFCRTQSESSAPIGPRRNSTSSKATPRPLPLSSSANRRHVLPNGENSGAGLSVSRNSGAGLSVTGLQNRR